VGKGLKAEMSLQVEPTVCTVRVEEVLAVLVGIQSRHLVSQSLRVQVESESNHPLRVPLFTTAAVVAAEGVVVVAPVQPEARVVDKAAAVQVRRITAPR
jgi:hypothetical protein